MLDKMPYERTETEIIAFMTDDVLLISGAEQVLGSEDE